jgi:hypothetical protein
MARERVGDPAVPQLRHLTPQQLDPVGRITAYYFTIAVGLVSVGAALGLTLNPSGYQQLSNPALAAVSVFVLAGAFAGFAIMANPRGPVLSRLRFQVVFGLVIVANLLSALSQLGSNHLARDDWGPVCLGLALLACAPYRSSYEILWFTLQGVLTAGILATLQAFTSEVTVSGIVVVVVAITPSLGIGLGAAAYSRSLVAGLRGLRAAESDARRAHDDELRQRLLDEDSVGELGALRSEVVPFFERLSAQDYMTDADSARATELSAGLRLAIVERLSNDPLSGLVSRFSDPDGALRSLGERQRAALRALIVAATGIDGINRESVTLTLSAASDRGEGARGSLAFAGGDPDRIRTTLQPFVRMLGFVLDDARLTIVPGRTTVRFGSTRTD